VLPQKVKILNKV